MLNIKDEIIDCQGTGIKTELLSINQYNPHFHSNVIEIIYVIEGTLCIESFDTTKTLKKNDTFSLDPGDIHYYWSDSDNIVLITYVEPTDISDYIISSCFFSFESDCVFPFQKEAMEKIKDTLLTLVMTDINKKERKAFSRRIMNLLVKYFDWLSFMCNPDDPLGISQERVRRIINYCNKNCEEKIEIKDLARLENISENYFSVIMSKTSFKNFGSLLNYSRCYKAEKLLLTTDLNIIDISFQCGFSDPKYFYAAFKQLFHCTPFQLKKKYQAICSKPNQVMELSRKRKKAVLSSYVYEYFIEKNLNNYSSQSSDICFS